MKRVLWIVMMASATACGGSGGANTQPVAPPTAPASTVLNVQPASLSAMVDGHAMALSIDASGKVTANEKLVATLTPAGEVRDDKNSLIATIAGDGRITIVEEPAEDLVIRDDGTVVAKGEEIVTIGADAILTGKLVSGVDAKFSYAGPPEGRRAMMLAWLVTASAANEPGAAQTSGSAATPTPAP